MIEKVVLKYDYVCVSVSVCVVVCWAGLIHFLQSAGRTSGLPIFSRVILIAAQSLSDTTTSGCQLLGCVLRYFPSLVLVILRARPGQACEALWPELGSGAFSDTLSIIFVVHR